MIVGVPAVKHAVSSGLCRRPRFLGRIGMDDQFRQGVLLPPINGPFLPPLRHGNFRRRFRPARRDVREPHLVKPCQRLAARLVHHAHRDHHVVPDIRFQRFKGIRRRPHAFHLLFQRFPRQRPLLRLRANILGLRLAPRAARLRRNEKRLADLRLYRQPHGNPSLARARIGCPSLLRQRRVVHAKNAVVGVRRPR